MKASDLRLVTWFDEEPMIPSSYLEHKWPFEGEHTKLITVIDWNALSGISGSNILQGECLCVRCALHRYHLTEGSCKTRTDLEDQFLLKNAAAKFTDPRKVEGVLFEAAYHFRRFNMDLPRM